MKTIFYVHITASLVMSCGCQPDLLNHQCFRSAWIPRDKEENDLGGRALLGMARSNQSSEIRKNLMRLQASET